jgi:hypothetical protein
MSNSRSIGRPSNWLPTGGAVSDPLSSYPGESMLSFRRSVRLLAAAALGCMACPAWGQPSLTTIQDVLYRADGTRFSGTMLIKWNSFQAGDTSNIATANLTVPIVNGVLKVALVPTTTASPGAQYSVTYNSGGQNQFTEAWAVPSSPGALKVSDVRVSSGSVVGPAPVTTATQISDVTGFANALAVRPQEGIGFSINRTAVINPSGQIDGSAGSPSDCVHVDGSSVPCGGAASNGLGPLYSDAEQPMGTVDGNNTIFTLARAPSPSSSLSLSRNGLILTQGVDYALNSQTVTFGSGTAPQPGDILRASYRYANPNNPLGSLTAAQVICSGGGNSTSIAVVTPLGSCTIPGGLLGTGDRVEVQFHFGHTGTGTAFLSQLNSGSTVILSRTSVAAETAVAGHAAFGILASGQSWDAQSWGNTLALASAAGAAGADPTQNLTITSSGAMTGTTTDTVNLLNFTVIRYPAQANQ